MVMNLVLTGLIGIVRHTINAKLVGVVPLQ